MNKLTRFANALATRGLTLEDTRDLHALTLGQVDDIKWAYAHANEVSTQSTKFSTTHAQYDAWYRSEKRSPPVDFSNMKNIEIEDTELDVVFSSVLALHGVTLDDACIDPRTQASSQRDFVVWSIMYTLGHFRRKAWERELRQDPLTEAEFQYILANDPDFNPEPIPMNRPYTDQERKLSAQYGR